MCLQKWRCVYRVVWSHVQHLVTFWGEGKFFCAGIEFFVQRLTQSVPCESWRSVPSLRRASLLEFHCSVARAWCFRRWDVGVTVFVCDFLMGFLWGDPGLFCLAFLLPSNRSATIALPIVITNATPRMMRRIATTCILPNRLCCDCVLGCLFPLALSVWLFSTLYAVVDNCSCSWYANQEAVDQKDYTAVVHVRESFTWWSANVFWSALPLPNYQIYLPPGLIFRDLS